MSNIADTAAQCNPRVVAENLLGNIQWIDDTKGFCRCPGEDEHTTPTHPTHCQVFLDGAAGVYCRHDSCFDGNQEVSRSLRNALRGLNGEAQGCQVSAAETKRRIREEQKIELLERRAKFSLGRILKEHKWTYDQIARDTKTPVGVCPDGHWRALLGLFKPDDIVWIGNISDSGQPVNSANFKTAAAWLEGDQPQGMLTCPASFRSNSISRCKENVLHRRFLVVESDALSKDEVGAIFRWLCNEVGLNLRAVVDTGGKSLHGWFDYPKQAIVDQLQVVLTHLGCDRALFRQSQPCRLPGALRDSKYQKLIYLDPDGGRGNPKLPKDALPLPNLFYDGHGLCFWRENDNGGWQKINETALDAELITLGFDPNPEGAALLSAVKAVKRQIQISQDIVFAGPLAGYRSGIQNIQGQRILVTSSPELITPKAGCWNTLRAVLDGLLGDDPNQLPCLYGWLKQADRSLRAGKFTPGQALCIAGPAGSGKSLLQSLITKILGGRSAKPFLALSGKTSFNADHFSAEHLVIEDDIASVDIRARRELGSGIKNITVNVSQSCHPKHKTQITLTPFWRLSISVNEEPENLLILPPLDESILDKIIILKGRKTELPMPTETPEEKDAFWHTLLGELPAFIHHLQGWDIPQEMRDGRYGVKAYHRAEIVDAVKSIQPEERLLSMIDQFIFANYFQACSDTILPRGINEWKGTAEQLVDELTDKDSRVRHEATKLFYYPGACGTYLGRLRKLYPDRFSSVQSHGVAVWKVKPSWLELKKAA